MYHPPRDSTIIFEALPTHDLIYGHAYFFDNSNNKNKLDNKKLVFVFMQNLEIIKETSSHKCEQSLAKLISISTTIVLPKQTPSTVSKFDIDEIVKSQSTDKTCHLLKEFFSGSLKDINKIKALFIKDLDSLHFDGHLICFEGRSVVNHSLVEKAVKIIHFATHAGITDIRRKIKSSIYCHNIFSVVDRIVGSCH
uniref:Integrase_SAM-like_N domain-containing protein n=1 Tax=Strongyloides venezuelensis TaxID=75913 RepID=A0A0K0FRF4_STRVS